MPSKHNLVLVLVHRVVMCDFSPLYLQHKFRESFPAMYLPPPVVHRVPARREVLKQHHTIGIESVCTMIVHLVLNFLLRHIEILVR